MIAHRIAVEEQSERTAADRSDEEIGSAIAIKVSRDRGTGIRVEVRTGCKGDVEEGFSVEIEESAVLLVCAEIGPNARHHERVLDPKFARFGIDFAQCFDLGVSIVRL